MPTKKSDPTRSDIMRAVKSKDTRPEMVVRRLLHGLGYRYRLHGKELPGKPDLVFSGRRKVIFVNGCFWHGHDCKRGSRQPKDNADYWRAKIGRNVERDTASVATLQGSGWQVLIVWECETKLVDREALTATLEAFLA
jgi:DNA mismatch endonuclease (patch repair protein)